MAKAKKDFSTAKLGPVYDSIAEAIAAPEDVEAPEVDTAPDTQEPHETQRKRRRTEYTEQEKQDHKNARKTQGRPGIKIARLNLAISPEMYDYVRIMARVRGEAMGDFIDRALREDMERYKDLYQEAHSFIERMDGR